MFTLHHAGEMRTPSQIEELRTLPDVKADEVALAKRVIGTFEGELDLSDFKDEYKEGLREVIQARIAGEEVATPPAVEAPTNVVNLMDALRKSLDAVSSSKKKPAKAELPSRKAPARAEGGKRRKAG